MERRCFCHIVETGTIVAGVTALGAYSWGWCSSKKFKFNPEGWFGDNTSSGGADKLGHAFSSYAMNNVLTDRLVRKGRPFGITCQSDDHFQNL